VLPRRRCAGVGVVSNAIIVVLGTVVELRLAPAREACDEHLRRGYPLPLLRNGVEGAQGLNLL